MSDRFDAKAAAMMSVVAKQPDQKKIESLMDYIFPTIRRAASKGLHSVVDPLKGLRTPISDAERDAVGAALSNLGYAVSYKHEGYGSIHRSVMVVSW